MVVAVYLLVAGHNAPGGGFAGGLVAGMGLMLRYLAAEGLSSAPFVLDPENTLTALTGSRALPTTLLLDGAGTVREVHMGEISRVQIDILRRKRL